MKSRFGSSLFFCAFSLLLTRIFLYLQKYYKGMRKLEEYIKALRQSKSYLIDKYRISRLGIFGSVAREEHTENSDVDICFEGSAMSAFTLCQFKSELETILGKDVDLLRIRKQLDGTYLMKSVRKDVVYV